MNKDLKLLPPPEKKVAAKVFDRLGFSYRQIGRILDVSKDTAQRYAQLETPEELRQFETDISRAFTDYEVILAAKAAAVIDKKIANAKVPEALEVYKVMRKLDQKQSNVAIQNNGGGMQIEFS